MALIDDVKNITGIKDDVFLSTMIPMLLDYANERTNREYTESDVPGGVKLFIAKACEYNAGDPKLSGRSMGSVSYSYNTEFPESVTALLKPYTRLKVLFKDDV